MTRSKSSKQWLQEHFSDRYVQRSKDEGYRSRASYKLLEIQESDALIRPGMSIVDLGAAPGGWSQVAAELAGPEGRIVASDILPMEPLPGVDFVQGDFTEVEVLERLLSRIEDDGVDLVISDMAPNISGMKEIDQPRAMHLADLALDLARSVLKVDAYLLVKVFQGEGFEAYRRELMDSFRVVKSRKPQASRKRSPELYLLAAGFRG